MKRILFITFMQLVIWGLCSGITLLYPNGGESLRDGDIVQITWSGYKGEKGNVKIEVLNGSTHVLIANSTADDGSYNWKIPVDLPLFKSKIKISMVSYPSLYDFSDNEFSVQAPYIRITNPSGGEIWKAGTTHTITWDSNCYEGEVFIGINPNINLSDIINWSAPNSGSYDWKVPEISSLKIDDCRIVIRPNIYKTPPSFIYSGFFTITRFGDSSNSGASNTTAPQTQRSISGWKETNIPSALVAEWYDDKSNGWNVSIRYSNGAISIRTGNVFYIMQSIYYNSDIMRYRVLTVKSGTNQKFTFFFDDVSSSSMNVNLTSGDVWNPASGFSGHHSPRW